MRAISILRDCSWLGRDQSPGRWSAPFHGAARRRNQTRRSGARETPVRALLRLLFLRLTRALLRADLSDTRKILGFDLRGRTVLAPDGVVDFLAVHADLLGGVDPQTHL